MGTKKFKILAFDPGLTNFGYSLLEGNTSNGDLVVLKIGELHPGPTADKAAYRDQVEAFDKRTISLQLLREGVRGLMQTFKPDFVAIEDIFINPHRPMAYGALCMITCVLRMLMHDEYGKYLVAITTKVCKKAVADRGDGGKVSVQEALKNHPHIHFKDPQDYNQASEHILDSIAVGAAFRSVYNDCIQRELEKQQ